ncbi:MAG: TRAP transporter substrate-binding protein [Lachnospiraceae bacterium]|jgi:tripartite ATP-independent transporter DctP family solute receptor|nr:TRAP transporter substrate-binding protein [Lachnospiraceae bacterium]
MKKIISLLTGTVLAAALLTGCAGSGAVNSGEATAENPLQLNLAHNLAEGHITSIALQQFADKVAEKSNGRITIKIFPNGTLGSETEVLEQLMAGVVDMTRVSAPGLATYNEGYHAFGLPYIFDDNENYYTVMGSDQMGDFFRSSQPDGFVTLTYYTSGSRSFYTINRPVRKPEDLKGLKVRVQDMKSQTDMMKALGGTPVAMAMGDVYTALQTGIIDGTENNETALTTGMHGEICKFYSVDQHTMIPDVLVIATSSWNSLSPEDQQILIEAAKESTENHIYEWEKAIDEAVETASSQMGVEFIEDVDKEAFRQATAGMIGEYRTQYPKVGEVLDIINSVE